MPTSVPVAFSEVHGRRQRGRPSNDISRSTQLEWIDVFETGNAEIDAFHRTLIQDCNRLLLLIDNEASWHLILQEARTFFEHCVEHFRVEEALLEQTRFPRCAEHVLEHRRLERQMTALLIRMEEVDGSLEEHRELPRLLGPALIELIVRHDLDDRSHMLHQQGR